MKVFKIVGIMWLCMSLSACISGLSRQNNNGYLDSVAVTEEIKAKLYHALGEKSRAIIVRSYGEEVQLTGYVDSEFTRKKAAEIASHIIDVKLVRNHLIVNPI